MSKKFVRITAFIIILTLVLTMFGFAVYSFGAENDGSYMLAAAGTYTATTTTADEKSYVDTRLKTLSEYLQYIHDNYKDDVTYEALLNGAFSGVMDSLGDPHSEYYLNEGDSKAFTENVEGEYSGIGVTLQMLNGASTITELNSKGNAVGAGLAVGDIITAVDGVSVSGMSLSEIVEKLRGAEGTTVQVTVSRDGVSQVCSVVRKQIDTSGVSYKVIDDNLGYIALTGFDSTAYIDVKAALTALKSKNVNGVILDIRNNGGGYVDSAVKIANLLIADKGKAIMHFSRGGEIADTYYSTGGMMEGTPVVLLVNENSASASEILAGALQDNDAATLVGTTTYGKGVAQSLGVLSDGSDFKLSMYYFVTPDKHVIDGAGITPDHTVYNYAVLKDRAAAVQAYADFAELSHTDKPAAGSSSLNVYAAQQRLRMLGYEASLNGKMDQETVKAVKQFQSDVGLWAYGTIDYSTMDALEEAVAGAIVGGYKTDKQLAKAIELLK